MTRLIRFILLNNSHGIAGIVPMLHFFEWYFLENENVKCINNNPVTISDYKYRRPIYHIWIIDCKEMGSFNWLWKKLKTHSPAGKIYHWIPTFFPAQIRFLEIFGYSKSHVIPFFKALMFQSTCFSAPFPVSHPFCHFAIAWRPLLPARSRPPASHGSAKMFGSQR